MASKTHPERSVAPPQISLSDKLLSSRICLPPESSITYAIFSPNPSNSVRSHESIEAARRLVLLRNASAALLDSILTSVDIGAQSFIYLFVVTSHNHQSGATSTLNQFNFEGLIARDISSFSPWEVYPSSSSSAVSVFPRQPLGKIYSHFLEAVRIRLLDDVATASTKKSNGLRQQTKRLKGGFVLSPLPTTSEWGSSWEYRTLARPLIYCHLEIHLSQSPSPSLVIHPLLLPTPFLPLSHALPLPPGMPITLLPHATPAFFLTRYTGPASALTKMFKESLQGLGVTGWESSPSSSMPGNAMPSSGFSRSDHSQMPAFIIAWISVENKQGEDKGIVIIYPTALCLAFTPSIASSFPLVPFRQPLNYIPELPEPLQSSPQVPPASTSLALSQPETQQHSRANTPLPSPIPIPMTSVLISSPARSRPALPSSPTSDSLRAFRTLTLSKSKDIRRVASEIGGYVDAVARERERERERLKREREGTAGSSSTSASPRLSRTTTTTPATTTTPLLPQAPTPISSSTEMLVSTQLDQINQQQSSSAPPNQTFYPSPPQTNPPTGNAQTSLINDSTTTAAQLSPGTATSTSGFPTAVPSTPTSSYDPFGNIDPAWAQPQTDTNWSQNESTYLGMDIDMDFGMGFSMDSGRGTSGTYGTRDGTGMDFEGAFTDDDFSFFDQPSRVTAPATARSLPPVPVIESSHRTGTGSGLTPSAGPAPMGMSPPLFGDIHAPQQISTPHSNQLQHPSPWGLSSLVEGFTPRYVDPSDGNSNTLLPDLMPPSPGQTPSSHSAPATPTVHLEYEHDSATIRRPSTGLGSWNGRGSSIFDPIPFSSYHRVADGKYAIGKFALPSPPDEEDRTELPDTPASKSHPISNGWGLKYKAATDPRIGVMRKLIGVKRKMTFEQGGREASGGVAITKMSPAWIREHEDWERTTIDGDKQKVNDDGARSEAESEDDDDLFDIESPIVSRPSTPPPVYLPLGPTLLHTQFHHSQLLPLSTSLRPPGAAVAPTNITTAPPVTSVPTPVSPAATMGVASDKSKSLEAAAFTVATEVVENSLWAEAWRANAVRSKLHTEVWSADVRTISQLLEAVPGLEGPLNIETLLTPPQKDQEGKPAKTLHSLEAPMVSIGKGDAIIQIFPTALRFWEKLGLGPRGGKKDSISFILYEDSPELQGQRMQQMETWLSTVVATYEGKHLGTLTPGSSSICPRDGLVPLRFDSFRKTLASFVASLPATQASLVLFIVTPAPTMSLASPTLRQVFSAVKKALKTYSEARILFQLIPEPMIFGSMSNPAANFSDLEILCASVYNRILLPVDRLMSRRFFEHGERVRKYFQEPAFTLSRPVHTKVEFVRKSHASLDVMDRHTFMHVGYQVSPCGKWILAACVDQRGEAHDLGVWLTQTPGEGDSELSNEMYVVKKVWDFAVQFAKRANIEWRLVLSRLGTIGESEFIAWTKLLDDAMANPLRFSLDLVALLCVEPDAPWTVISSRSNLPPKPKPSKPSMPARLSSSSTPKHHAPSIFADISSTIYALPPRTHLPCSIPPSPADLGLLLPYIPEPVPSNADVVPDPQPHILSLHPKSSTTLIRVPPSPSPTSVSMLHIHLLHNTHPSLTSPPPISTMEGVLKLHSAITRNFHDLAVLAGVRWNLNVNPLLPFHLAAVEAMRIALDRDRCGTDGTDC